MGKKDDGARKTTDDSMTQSMRFACWITKATHTHSEYVVPIAFPRQRWFHESTSTLHYRYRASRVVMSTMLHQQLYLVPTRVRQLCLGNVPAARYLIDTIDICILNDFTPDLHFKVKAT